MWHNFTMEGVLGTVTVAMGLKKDTGRYLVGVHRGREYWFEKAKLEAWSVEPSGLQISIDESAWERRVNADRTAPAVEVAAHKMRKCLLCKEPFAAGRVQYVCGPCKNTANWREGATIFCSMEG